MRPLFWTFFLQKLQITPRPSEIYFKFASTEEFSNGKSQEKGPVTDAGLDFPTVCKGYGETRLHLPAKSVSGISN